MAGPLNGIGGQQQVPISNTFRPGEQNSSQGTKENESTPTQDAAAPAQNTAPTESQAAETNNQDILQSQVAEALSGSSESSEPAEQRRGSLIDIQV
jgi:hypothetical protein